MRHFIIDVIIACFLGIMICCGFEYYNITTSQNNYQYKNEYLNAHAKDIKLLLIGNSHFENSLNPHLLGDSVFDAAISGRWIYYDCCLLEKYIDKMSNLKIVIFPLGYKMPFFNYHNHPLREIDKVYINHYALYMSLFYDRLPDKYTYCSSILAGIAFNQERETISCDSLGYEKIVGQISNWKTEQNISPTLVKDDNALSLDTAEYTLYLSKLAEICHRKKIRFIVVTAPCHDSYIKNTEDLGHTIRYDIIQRVQKQYPLEYIDYLNDPDFRADSLYRNCSHLNHVGASKFALRLKKDFSL